MPGYEAINVGRRHFSGTARLRDDCLKLLMLRSPGCAECLLLLQVWVRDVREAVELLDEATGQRTPKEQVPSSACFYSAV